ncbi:hypothetical protein [Methylobacterium nodulans]|uniref:hypothetical protein n=1 Tax=Methylobacterium nodulans TaxID=114616 RepID=UPI0012ED0E1C|nr:hypothetical protein [Methylobacterium nodulans]
MHKAVVTAPLQAARTLFAGLGEAEQLQAIGAAGAYAEFCQRDPTTKPKQPAELAAQRAVPEHRAPAAAADLVH